MPTHMDETLARELREVAEGLVVPAMPRLRGEPTRAARRWQPLLAAAAVAAILAGSAALVATIPGGPDNRPVAPEPSITPTPIESIAPIDPSASSLPHLVEGRLYVDGTAVAGTWWSVQPAGRAWIALREDYTWWWGRGPKPNALPNGEDVTPRISPDGRYVAVVRTEDGDGILTVLDTRSGRDFGGTPANVGAVRWEDGAYVTAVTDDGTVVIRRGGDYLTWSHDEVADTSSGQMVFGATSAGVVAGDVDGEETYLATLSERGDLNRVGELPQHDDLMVSPERTWVAWTPIGTTGGEVTSIPSLQVGMLEGEQAATLAAPDGWQFKVRGWAWEDDSHLVSTVTGDRGRERMARCSPLPARCLLIRTD